MNRMTRFFLLTTVLSGFFILGCNSGNDKKTDTETTMSKDTAVVIKDTTGNSGGGQMGKDSFTDHSTVKPNPALKGKNGKVSSVMITSGDKSKSTDIDKEGYYKNVDILPGFPGGQKALDKFIADHVVYPPEAIDNGIEGTVVVNFAVDEMGLIYTPHVESDKIGYGLEIAAMKVVNQMPQWTPGRIKGKNVKRTIVYP